MIGDIFVLSIEILGVGVAILYIIDWLESNKWR
jgi:hypothetical protein